MECEKWQQLISLWQDGELNPQGIQSLQKHLHSCAICSAQQHYFQNLDSLYKEVAVSFDKDFSNEIMQKVQNKKDLPLYRWCQVVAAMVLFTVGGIFFKTITVGPVQQPVSPTNIAKHKKRFPYFVKLTNAPNGYYFIIENVQDEQQWQNFLRSYTRKIMQQETRKHFNRYSINAIPVSYTNYGEY